MSLLLTLLFIAFFPVEAESVPAPEDSILIHGRVMDNWWYPAAAAKVTFITSSGSFTAETDTEGYYALYLPHIKTDVDNTEFTPQLFTLHQNYPNPFNPSTVIGYSLDISAYVTLNIFSVTGQRIRQLLNESQIPGFYSVRWDGRDEHGQSVGTGMYLCRLQAGGRTDTKKMLLLDGGGMVFGSLSKPGTLPASLKKAAVIISEWAVVIEKEGCELFRDDAVSVSGETDEALFYFTLRKILPEGITDEDVSEIIRLTFFHAMNKEDMWIPDTVNIIGSDYAYMSKENIHLDIFPEIDELQFVMIDPEDIKNKADMEGTYMYFLFYPFVFEKGKVTVGLQYIQAVSKDAKVHAMVGGGYKAEFTKQNGVWTAKYIGGFII